MMLDDHIAVWRRKRTAWNQQRANMARKISNQRKQLAQYESRHGTYQQLVAQCERQSKYITDLEREIERLGEGENERVNAGLATAYQAGYNAALAGVDNG